MAGIKKSVKVNLTGLNKVLEGIPDKVIGDVGVFGDSTTRDPDTGEKSPLTNAEIGVIQEFGSPTNGIPSRSFLRMPLETKSKEIKKKVLSNRAKIKAEIADGNAETILEKILLLAAEAVDEAFQTGGFGKWPANAQSTIDRKGSSRPLIDTQQLRRSIATRVKKKRG